MMDFLEAVKNYGFTLLFIFQVLLGIFVVMLKDKFAPKSLSQDVDEIGARVNTIETRMERIPSTDEIHKLEKQLCDFRGDLKAVDRKFDGIDSLLRRMEKQVNRMDEFLRRGK